jgi:hypothetical protein
VAEAIMLMRVRERNNEVEIQFYGLGRRHHVVLGALSGSQPIDGEQPFDRAKLESLSVHARADTMNIRLRAKHGESFDVTQLYRSLRRALVEGDRGLLSAPLAG